jgi:hypothetical protein
MSTTDAIIWAVLLWMICGQIAWWLVFRDTMRGEWDCFMILPSAVMGPIALISYCIVRFSENREEKKSRG